MAKVVCRKCGCKYDDDLRTECPECESTLVNTKKSKEVKEETLEDLANFAEELEENQDFSELSELVDQAWEFQNPELKEMDFSESDELAQMVEFIGERAPIKFLEDLLGYYVNQYNELIKTDIPELMHQLGQKKVEMEDGHKVNIEEKVSTETLDEDALDSWLAENGYSDDIKESLVFTKGEKALIKLKEALDKKGISYTHKGAIHYQTLNRIIRERKAAGVPEGEDEDTYEILPPDDILYVHSFEKANIK